MTDAYDAIDRVLSVSRATTCHKKETYPPLPQLSTERLQQTTLPGALELDRDLPQKVSRGGQYAAAAATDQTVLYLAYGSNLSTAKFRGDRGIKPLSQMNVCVPELRLTFDIPGLPYLEPCFAGSGFRTDGNADEKGGYCVEYADADAHAYITDSDSIDIEKAPLLAEPGQGQRQGGRRSWDYHKNRWHGPLIGVVYEVTVADYAHIIATEGGGAGYRDMVVTCYPFPESYRPSDPVPGHLDTRPFKAHTLLSPVRDGDSSSYNNHGPGGNGKNHLLRPDPAYAQPSARYLDLITTGAAELDFPTSYRAYLASIRPYRITTVRQRAGQAIFLVFWGPLLRLLMLLAPLLADADGRSPRWLVDVQEAVFGLMWMSYDTFFRRVFGEGERTMGDV
jgi:hypothetical protein